MKNKIRYNRINRMILPVFALLFSVYLISCTGDFEEINTNPNAAESVPTTFLLTSAQQKLININSNLGFNKTLMFYSQLWSQRETTNRSRYDLSAESDWTSFYSSGVPDLVSIIELNSGDDKSTYAAYGDNDNQIAVARIMKAWIFSLATDTWGDIPYTEANNRNFAFPAYDLQSDIYPALITELKESAALINEVAPGFISGDMMYDGDMTKWKKFANSLRARLALRMMKANSTLAQSELSDALSSSIFTSNDDQALINYQSEEANASPIYIEFLRQNWTFPSELLINRLTTLNDPRISVYAELNGANSAYVGLPYGLDDGTSTSAPWSEDTLSMIGSRIRESEFPSILMSYSELLFIQAEAAENGWVAGNATTLYNNAITSNMEFWGVGAADITTYLADAGVVYNSVNSDVLLGEQRWISFYTQGAQAFFEWRRTGEPSLSIPVGTTVFNSVTEIPRRFFYPVQEQQLNGDNLTEAQSRLSGGDLLTSRIWIDQ